MSARSTVGIAVDVTLHRRLKAFATEHGLALGTLANELLARAIGVRERDIERKRRTRARVTSVPDVAANDGEQFI